MIRKKIIVLLSAAVVLLALQSAWYFLANSIELAESLRGPAKVVVSTTGVALVLGVAIWVARTTRRNWALWTASSAAGVVGLSSILLIPMLAAIGIHRSNNSAFLGYSETTQRALGAVGFIVFLLVAAVLGVLAGWIGRWPRRPPVRGKANWDAS